MQEKEKYPIVTMWILIVFVGSLIAIFFERDVSVTKLMKDNEILLDHVDACQVSLERIGAIVENQKCIVLKQTH